MESRDDEIELLRRSMLEPRETLAYFGERDLSVWGIAPFALSRDSDALERSNWAAVSENLLGRFPEHVEAIEVSHWALGWVRLLLVDTRDIEALVAVLAWQERLAEHPVADDDMLAEEENMERESSWEDWGREMTLSLAQREGIEDLEEEDERAKEAFFAAMAHTGNDLDEESLRCFVQEAFGPGAQRF